MWRPLGRVTIYEDAIFVHGRAVLPYFQRDLTHISVVAQLNSEMKRVKKKHSLRGDAFPHEPEYVFDLVLQRASTLCTDAFRVIAMTNRCLHDLAHPLQELYKRTISDENQKTFTICNTGTRTLMLRVVVDGTKYDSDSPYNWTLSHSSFIPRSSTIFVDSIFPIDAEVYFELRDPLTMQSFHMRLRLLHIGVEKIGVKIADAFHPSISCDSPHLIINANPSRAPIAN